MKDRPIEEQLADKLTDSHLELSISDKLLTGSTLIKKSPSDHSVDKKGKIKGKAAIEYQALADRNEAISHILLDALGTRKGELLNPVEMPITKLVDAVIKDKPKHLKVEAKVSVGFLALYDDIDMEEDE